MDQQQAQPMPGDEKDEEERTSADDLGSTSPWILALEAMTRPTPPRRRPEQRGEHREEQPAPEQPTPSW